MDWLSVGGGYGGGLGLGLGGSFFDSLGFDGFGACGFFDIVGLDEGFPPT